MNKILLLLSLCFLTQCYTEPFFELTVKVVDQNLNPVTNASVKIEVVDIENGDIVDGSIIYFDTTTNSQGQSNFSFENKAFVTVRTCFDNGLSFMCKEGQVYLEDNINKEITLMLQVDSCLYCF